MPDDIIGRLLLGAIKTDNAELRRLLLSEARVVLGLMRTEVERASNSVTALELEIARVEASC